MVMINKHSVKAYKFKIRIMNVRNFMQLEDFLESNQLHPIIINYTPYKDHRVTLTFFNEIGEKYEGIRVYDVIVHKTLNIIKEHYGQSVFLDYCEVSEIENGGSLGMVNLNCESKIN